MAHCFLKVEELQVVNAGEVVRIRWILSRAGEAGPGLVEEEKCAACDRSNSLSDVRVKEAGSKFPCVDDVVEAMNRPFERIVDLILVDRRGVLGQSMALCLDETSVLSTAKVGEVRAVADVRTPKDAVRCALKSCRRVSIVSTSFFCNLAELCPSGNRLRLRESFVRLCCLVCSSQAQGP